MRVYAWYCSCRLVDLFVFLFSFYVFVMRKIIDFSFCSLLLFFNKSSSTFLPLSLSCWLFVYLCFYVSVCLSPSLSTPSPPTPPFSLPLSPVPISFSPSLL